MGASDRRRRISAEAVDWWVRLQSEHLSRCEREQFVDWLREPLLHIAEMLRMNQVHCVLEDFEGWSQLATTATEPDATVISLPRRVARAARGEGIQAEECQDNPSE